MTAANSFINMGIKMSKEPYPVLDKHYLNLDREHVKRTRNIRMIPQEENRRGGKYSYAEWAHVIGIFQTLFYLHANKPEGNKVLDIGCGTGLLAIAAEPLLGGDGSYLGLDVMKKDIEFCQSHYPSPPFSFKHFDVANSMYAPNQKSTPRPWDLPDSSFDLVTALSVWTHLSERDGDFYFKEINRVLKPGGKAIVTFFLLDDIYYEGLPQRTAAQGRFHMTAQDHWVFDQKAYDSETVLCPKWVESPEHCTGVTERGLARLLEGTGLKEVQRYVGNWKERPGVYFQDVLVFQKAQ